MKKSYLPSLSAVALAFLTGGWITPAAGFPQASNVTQAAAGEAASFTLSPIAAQQVRNAPISVTLTARNSQGAVIPEYTGTPSFTAAGPGGNIEVLTPTIGGFVNGVWTGNVIINQYAENVILTAMTGGIPVASGSFNLVRGPLARLSWTQVSSTRTVDTPFGVSLRAEDAGGNLVEDFAGNVSLAAVSASPGAPTGTGTLRSGDLDATYGVSRSQCVYTPAEVGATGRLTALSMDITDVPDPGLENFTIRVKHTSTANYNSPHAGWEAGGWTVVYRGTLEPETTGWHTFPFTVPFDYDGTSNLMVDFSYKGEGFGWGGDCLATTTTDSRKIIYQTFYSSDPLTWSGQSEYFQTYDQLPNLRFTSYNTLSPIRPAATGAFTGGVWNGTVSIPFAAEGVKLLATDGADHSGTSGFFAVEEAKPVIRPGTLTETFEKQPLGSEWKFTGTNAYRSRVTNLYEPHGGARHLIMYPNNYQLTRSEATWTVDLRGMSGVVLKFWAKGGENVTYSNEPTTGTFTGGANFNGVAVSVDGTTWHIVHAFRTLNSTWKQFTLDLDNLLSSAGLKYNSTFRIRFNQYGDSGYDDPFALDDIELTTSPSPHQLKVTGPALVREGDGPARFAVTLPFSAAADTVVDLVSSGPAKATVPGQVTVPAGRLSASFMVQPVDDTLVDGSKTVAITATNGLLAGGSRSLVVLDNDQSLPTFTVPTTSTVEGAASIVGTVSVDTPVASPTTFQVTSGDAKEITVPSTVTIPLGATSVPVPITIVDDTRVDGLQSTTITVSEPGGGNARSVTIGVADNETLDLSFRPLTTPPPTSVNEGSGSISFSPMLPGTVTTSSTLTFTSSSPGKIIPPAAKNISAGGMYAGTIVFTIVDDQISEVSGPVTLTMSSPGFNSDTYVVTFLDNDPHHFTISPIASPQVAGAPIPVTVTARDPSGGIVPGFLGPVSFGAGGGIVWPGSATTFTGGVHTGTVRINEAAEDFVLTVTDSQGHIGSSNPFDIGSGTFQQLAWAPISRDQPPAGNIPVTLKAVDAGGNVDPAVNAPVTVRALAPVPALTVGTGEDDTFWFLNTSDNRARSQVLHLADELGGGRTLGGIALNLKSGAAGQVLNHFTIRLKTTTRTKLDTATGWDGDGWTVVHQSTPKLSDNGWVTFLFDVPFEYDGTENLLVDYSYNNPSYFNSIRWGADYEYGSSRVLYGNTDSVTDPLTWSGTANSSNIDNDLPQTRFLDLQPVPAVIPATPTLTAGMWSGMVSFSGNIDRAFLEAVDGTGRRAFSDALRIGTPVIPTGASVPFTDGFESGSLSSAWETSFTGNGRVRVLSTYTPHTGTGHAISDTSSFNEYARTELTLPLNLIGHTGVTLGFWAKRFGTTDNAPPAAQFTGGADFDGVAISADGTTWYEIQPLRGMTNGTWKQFTIDLDAAIAMRGLAYTSDFRIRFNQYGNSYATSDGMALDDVSVTGNAPTRLTLTLPEWIGENSDSEQGTVQLPSTAATDTFVTLTSSSPLALMVPAGVTIAAGQTSATFNLTATDDSVINGPRKVVVTGTSASKPPVTATVELRDDDSGTLALSAPGVLVETGATAYATLTISPAPVGNLAVSLTSSQPLALRVPATVLIQPGQTSVVFPLEMPDDYKATSPRTVTLTASLGGWPAATATVTVNDKGNRSFNWSSSGSALEGATTNISLNAHGVVSEDVVFTLSSSDTSRLTLPATATIPAGSQFVSIPLTGVDNDNVEGTRTVVITASTGGIQTDTRDLQVQDNDAHHFSFDPIPTPRIRSEAFPITISAYDMENRLISNYTATAPITASGDAGVISTTPASITFAAGVAYGNLTVNTASENVRLHVSLDGTHSGTSAPFTVQPSGPAKYTWNNIVSTVTAGHPFSATITARDAGNAILPDYNGYVTLSTPPVGSGPERTIGTGSTTTTSYPFLRAYPKQRTQIIYPVSEVGSANSFTSLSLYIANPPSFMLNAWTIRLKHTQLTSYSSSASATWEGSGWTTVYAANQTISQSGWVTFNFTTPFVYNGTGSLMVDLSFNNSTIASGSNYAQIRVSPTGAARTIASYGNASGSPLTWSGNSPYIGPSYEVPQIKLGIGSPAGPVSPSTVLLTNGKWTGTLLLGTATTSTSLTATDVNGATGKSNNFAVVSVPDNDGDGLPNPWETANLLSNGNKTGADGAMGDPDGDGIPNLLEYALNLSPRTPDSSGLPLSVKTVNPVDGDEYLEFTYRRRPALTGIRYIIETSADCSTWSPAATQYETAAGPLPTGDGVTETVTVRILPKISESQVKFVRLRVAAP